MGLVINIRDTAGPRLEQLARQLSSPARAQLHRFIADAAMARVQRRFAQLAVSNRNRFGARGGFWNRMISGTFADADEQQARVRMPREVAQRFFGGPIVPKPARMLAIPARAEAYGRSPRQFNDLRFVPTGPDRGMLVQRDQSRVRVEKDRRKDRAGRLRVRSLGETGGGAFYFLVRSVTQRPDPGVLPGDDELTSAALRGARAFVLAAQRLRGLSS